MNKFKKIKKVIENYQKQADKLFASYKKEEAEARERYSESGFREQFIQKRWPQFSGESQASAEIAAMDLNNLFDEAREDVQAWMTRMPDAGTTQMLDTINKFSLNLSIDELRLIENSVRGSYVGMLIFEELASRNGFTIRVPKMREYVKALESARKNALLSVKAYAGRGEDGYPGRDLLSDWVHDGVLYGNYQDNHLIMAELFLKEGGQLDRLEQLFESSNAPMSYTLNDRETEKMKKGLESIVDEKGEINKKAVQQLTENDPDFVDKLRSMPDGSFDGMEAVREYFKLDDEEKNINAESTLSPELEQAASYESRQLKPIDKAQMEGFM